MVKQPRLAPKQAESECYKCIKRDHYASQFRMEYELTCYKCDKNDHRVSECRPKVDIPPTCTYFLWLGHTLENYLLKWSNEAVENQDLRFAKNIEPTKPKGSGPSGQNNLTFMKEDDPVGEENIVAAFKRSADGEALTKQRRIQDDIEAYNKAQVKPKIAVRMNPDFPITYKPTAPSKLRIVLRNSVWAH